MSNSQQLIDDLKAAYPNLEVELTDKGSTPLVDCDGVPDKVLGLSINDVFIVDLFVSECSCFDVDPETDYGISDDLARRVNLHNGLDVPAAKPAKTIRP